MSANNRRYARLPAVSTALGLLLVLAAAATVEAQSVVGRVVEEATGEPVPGATVSIFRATAQGLVDEEEHVLTVLSGGDGRFRMDLPSSGSFALRTQRIGYAAATTAAVGVRPGETVHVELRLSTEAVALEPLRVTARQPPNPYSARLARMGHYERRAIYGPEGSGFGRFLSLEELERRNAFYVSDYLAMIPGVTVRGGGGRRAPAIFLRSVTGIAGGQCRPSFYINRMYIDTAEIDEFISARDIAAIEVYPGYTSPAEFPPRSACGVIVFLTK